MSVTHLQGDCREVLRTLPELSVHCCVTSPPYFGLRDYGVDGQLGLERTPEEYVANMVDVFREVRRVLRDDGVLWLNIGDSYCSDDKWGGSSSNKNEYEQGYPRPQSRRNSGCKPKEQIGVPWMTAFGLRQDGWYVRQEVIWNKPNPMTESVEDRCTKSHEQLFLLTKKRHYHFDYMAIQEPCEESSKNRIRQDVESQEGSHRANGGEKTNGTMKAVGGDETRNKRSVWTVSTKPYKGAHFAVFPPDLIEPCILSGTSQEGCCHKCGAPYERIVEKERVATRPALDTKTTGDSMVDGNRDPERHVTRKVTKGWQQSCKCEGAKSVPCTVLDPFGGSGTTGQVAQKFGCHAILIELNPKYIDMQKRRVQQRSLLA